MKSPIESLVSWINSFNPYSPDKLAPAAGGNPLPLTTEGSNSKMPWVFAGFFVAFAGWAVIAPIDSGVVLNGVVVVQGNRKVVQHPLGGVVSSIMVKEGSHVRAGDLLFKLNPLNTEANLAGAEVDYIEALVTESRLKSEREGAPEIRWDADLAPYTKDPRFEAAKAVQTGLFMARKGELKAQQGALSQQIAGLKAQNAGLEESQAPRTQQIALLSEEVRNNRELAAEGHVPRARVSELERQLAEANVSLSEMQAEKGKNLTAIAGLEFQLAQSKATWLKELETQLVDAEKSHISLKAKVASFKSELAQTDVRAPAAGIVVGLKVNTVGGVVAPGQTQMEIVPEDSPLIVEADVPTNMIDKVHAGLLADLRFSAFNTISTPVVAGRVKLVGADRQLAQPPVHPNDYYLAQVETSAQGVRQLDGKVIQAGMPVEVVVKTGERSFMSYLLKPLQDRLARSFKEGM
ncbi:membrane fusion protein, protease secretion system [Novimethylophilus kurashikiensis]|uniref:Membrane fusion protein (MFP) family protein n=1 Tax=Novimethylophilus kurashikiensis TaxID=1825523 RepID=A0A2R5F9D1_9PROT|nr:HlyD family type I secretion periplasmic adaptor subunit [Novimethylophilus kurashikiensis]GBG14429.1 membrane fusion protein, protease secretion system [Novimethylophilus kurashikiensis]